MILPTTLNRPFSKLCLTLSLASTLISGCTLGPDFHRAPPPPVKRYTAETLPSHTTSAPATAGKSQYFAKGQDIPAEWWKVFHSEPLNQLIKAALSSNPDLQAATAGLRIAQETALAQRSFYFPRADANFISTRQETAHTLTPIVASNSFFYTLITPQLTISYIPDVFGSNRRQVESLEAQVAAEVFQREALALTISSNVVLAVIEEASLRAQIRATQNTIALGKRQLKMLREEHAVGEIGLEGVSAQEALLAQLESTLPPLQKQLAQQHHAIAVLCGQFPSDKLFDKFELKSLNLPGKLPLSLPSTLVQQRPDIRAAEALAHAASAQIGVAVAQRLPNILLTATAGSDGLNLYTLFNSNTNFWALTANVAQPVFNAGLLRHRQRAAVAAYKQADAQYRSVVLSAFQDVADTLKAIQYDANNLQAAQAAVQASKKSLNIAQQQLAAGAVGYLAVLSAEQAYQQSEINLVQSQANRFIDTVALFQALGGGWWNHG
ncbi:Outer membrane protein OprM precursor [Legionella massiliensis]|uniref:Outer membrane protein OprM n=1 Tax=Legionella massiliensis TaxID=1034943 RepID=A0A078KX06_9GAMM|nr:efflux transporter outer membrane subunit [Legionella massiliensis]CDZ77491.1 Outer membrane protein OprM precursor [Legionella massiliensis]CEE13229.1 Outer membrane protein OprM precursor [Legionella massiliensis]